MTADRANNPGAGRAAPPSAGPATVHPPHLALPAGGGRPIAPIHHAALPEPPSPSFAASQRCCVCPPVIDTAFYKTVHFWMRVAAVVLAICTFAPLAAKGTRGASTMEFSLFCSFTASILALMWIVCQILGQRWARGLVPLVVDSVWAVFWLACAAVLSDSLADLNASIEGTNRAVPGFCRYYPGACQETNRRRTLLACAVAFAWLSWALCIGQVVCDSVDLRRGRSMALPKATPGAISLPPATRPTSAPTVIVADEV